MDRKTELMQQIFTARIKVKGIDSGFIPAEMAMAIGVDKFTIKLKAITKIKFSNQNLKKTLTALEDFELCIIHLDGIDEEPVVNTNNSGNQVTPRGNQETGTCEDVEKEKHGMSRNAGVGNIHQLLPMQKNISSNGTVIIKKVFSMLKEGLMFDGLCSTKTIISPVNHFCELEMGFIQRSRNKLGKFWIRGPNFFVKREIRRDLENKVPIQVKDRANRNSILWYDEKETEDAGIVSTDNEDHEEVGDKHDTTLEEIDNFECVPYVTKGMVTDEDLLDAHNQGVLNGVEVEEESEEKEYETENESNSALEPEVMIREFFADIEDLPLLNENHTSLNLNKQPGTPCKGDINSFPITPSKSESVSIAGQRGGNNNADLPVNSGTFSLIPNTNVICISIPPNNLIKEGLGGRQTIG